MKQTAPDKLIVCEYKIHPLLMQHAIQFYSKGIPMPAELQAIRRNHVLYVHNLCEKGIIWASGPSSDFKSGLNVFSVDSINHARKAQRNDPFYINQLFYDDKYFEWIIHEPLEKTCAAHRERIIENMKACGIQVEDSPI